MSEHASFDLQSQTAGTITNVGGDQITLQRGGGRTRTIGRAVAFVGLALVFVGLGLLGYAAFFAKQRPDRNRIGRLLELATRTIAGAGALVDAGAGFAQALAGVARVLGPAAGAALALL